MQKNAQTTALISHASKEMLKILQARLQQYVSHALLDVQAGFRKGRGTRDQIADICWIIEKTRESQKNIYVHFIDYTKAFDCVDHNKLWCLRPRQTTSWVGHHLTYQQITSPRHFEPKLILGPGPMHQKTQDPALNSRKLMVTKGIFVPCSQRLCGHNSAHQWAATIPGTNTLNNENAPAPDPLGLQVCLPAR